MKSFLTVLLGAVLFCAPTFAGDNLAPISNDGTVTVEKKLDIVATTDTLLDEIRSACEEKASEVNAAGSNALMTYQALSQVIPYLKGKGVPENVLASLVETRETLLKKAKAAGKLFRLGLFTGRYAMVLVEEAKSPSDKLRAVALFSKALEIFNAAEKELEGVKESIEKAEVKVRELLESLEVRPTPAPPKPDNHVVSPDDVIEIPIYRN